MSLVGQCFLVTVSDRKFIGAVKVIPRLCHLCRPTCSVLHNVGFVYSPLELYVYSSNGLIYTFIILGHKLNINVEEREIHLFILLACHLLRQEKLYFNFHFLEISSYKAPWNYVQWLLISRTLSMVHISRMPPLFFLSCLKSAMKFWWHRV